VTFYVIYRSTEPFSDRQVRSTRIQPATCGMGAWQMQASRYKLSLAISFSRFAHVVETSSRAVLPPN